MDKYRRNKETNYESSFYTKDYFDMMNDLHHDDHYLEFLNRLSYSIYTFSSVCTRPVDKLKTDIGKIDFSFLLN